MRPVSVTQVNEYIARRLRDDQNLRGLVVEAEISGLSKSGPHHYLTLKDADSQIRAVIWGQNAAAIDIVLDDLKGQFARSQHMDAVGNRRAVLYGRDFAVAVRNIHGRDR